MPAPYEVPGLDYLLQQKAALQAQLDTNTAQIAVLENTNDTIQGELDLLQDTIEYAMSLTTLAAPENFSVASNNPGEATLTWDSVTDADDYAIEYDTDADFAEPFEQGPSGNTSPFTVTGLDTGTLYYFRVKAVAADWNDSEWATDSETIS